MSPVPSPPAFDSEARRVAHDIVRRLRAAGFAAYFVGGCVRDQVLGQPPKDYDIATAARPDDVRRLFRNVILVGAQFGVCRVRRGTIEIEVAAFRSESGYSDGRHPDTVQFADAQHDVLRRDFTINGLLLDPDTGEILDFVGGQADLAAGCIRAIGDAAQRFDEDRLRLLRAVRFAARLGFTIDAATWQALRERAALIVSVSAERIRDELGRILTDGAAPLGMTLLADAGLLAPILPEVARVRGLRESEWPPHGQAPFERLLRALGAMSPPSLPLALAWLLADVGWPEARERGVPASAAERTLRLADDILHRQRWPNALIREVIDTLADRDTPGRAVASGRPSAIKRLLRLPHIDTLLAYHAIAGLVGPDAKPPPSHDVLLAWRARLSPGELRPPRLVDGRDLIAWGYAPGRHFETILAAVQDAQLDGALTEREAARQFVESQFPRARGGTSEADAPASLPGPGGPASPPGEASSCGQASPRITGASSPGTAASSDTSGPASANGAPSSDTS